MIKLTNIIEIKNVGKTITLSEEGKEFLKDHVEFSRIVEKYDLYIDDNDYDDWDSEFDILSDFLQSSFCKDGKTTPELIKKFIINEFPGIEEDPESIEVSYNSLVKYFR